MSITTDRRIKKTSYTSPARMSLLDTKSKLYAKSNKISRNEIIDTFKKDNEIKHDTSSSDDIPNNMDYDTINTLLVDNDGNRFDLYNDDDNDDNNDDDNDDNNDDDNDDNNDDDNDDNNDDNDDSMEYAIDEKEINPRQYGGKIVYDDVDVTGVPTDDKADEYVDQLDSHAIFIKKNESNYNQKSKTKSRYERAIGRVKFEKESVDLDDNKIPIHCEIIIKDTDIPNFLKETPSFTLHEDVNYPKFSLGFTHWIHASKNKTDVFNTFIGKKRVYQVINGYERYIDDYDENIGNISKSYFKLNDKPNILSRAFL